MVLDLLTLTGLPVAIGATEAVRHQQVFDEEAESEERQQPFYLDVYCDTPSKKRDEVHDTIVVLKEGKIRLWPKDPKTNLPKAHPDGSSAPHPLTAFYLPFPTEDLPHRPIPARRILGLVSTIPSNSSISKTEQTKPKLNWIYVDKDTLELKYGPRAEAREHFIGPWDWTEDDEQGITFDGEESLVAVEEKRGGYGWVIYWDYHDDRLKETTVGKEKRVLRCSLERRVVKGREKFEVE